MRERERETFLKAVKVRPINRERMKKKVSERNIKSHIFPRNIK